MGAPGISCPEGSSSQVPKEGRANIALAGEAVVNSVSAD